MKIYHSFAERYGPWAIVTGAALGIGAEFASQLAARGLNLILVDRDAAALAQTAASIAARCSVELRTVVADLADENVMAAIDRAADGCTVGFLVNNAAQVPIGMFMDMPESELIRTITVNCRAPLVLARRFGPAMAARRRGGIIFLASTSCFQGTALVATYAATKAYNLVLGEGLWDEFREHGVDVLSFCPGPTDTPGWRESRPAVERVPGISVMDTGAAVDEALGALSHGPTILSGRANRFSAFLLKNILPRRIAVRLIGSNTRKLFAR